MQIVTSCYGPGVEAVLQYQTHGVINGVDRLTLNIWMGDHNLGRHHKPVSASWAFPRKHRTDYRQATLVPACKAFENAVSKFLQYEPYPVVNKLLCTRGMQELVGRAVWLRNRSIMTLNMHCKKVFGDKYCGVPLHGSLQVDNFTEVLQAYYLQK